MRKKSQEEKERQGTYEPSKEVGNSMPTTGELIIIPPIPTDWPPEAGKIWRRICQIMKQSGYLTHGFLGTIKSYCWAEYEHDYARLQLINCNFVDEKKRLSQWMDMEDRSFKRMMIAGKELGLTPGSAFKIPVKKVEVKQEESLLN